MNKVNSRQFIAFAFKDESGRNHVRVISAPFSDSVRCVLDRYMAKWNSANSPIVDYSLRVYSAKALSCSHKWKSCEKFIYEMVENLEESTGIKIPQDTIDGCVNSNARFFKR